MDLMKLLPSIHDKNDTIKELQGVLSCEINKLASDFDKTIDQCFVSTATDLLSRYEKVYGISVDVSKSDSFRRERIKARAKGIGTVTKKMLEDVAASYSNGEVEVIENYENYSFIVKFIGVKGIPANMADLTLTIKEISPAHLAFTFEYTYNIWNDIFGMTWIEASAFTWNQLRMR